MKKSTSQIKLTPLIVGAGAAFLLFLTIILGIISPKVLADAPGTITTEDSRADGITMNLFDYSGYNGKNDASKYYLDEYPKEVSANDLGCQLKKNDGSLTNWQTQGTHSKSGINRNYNTDDFRRFLFSSSGRNGCTLNNGGSTARTGIVQNRLGSDGYPVLTNDDKQQVNDGTLRTNGESLNYLFNNDTANAKIYGKTVYQNVTGLMRIDTNKSNSNYTTYTYDSDQNYAYYNPVQGNNGSFKVYSVPHAVTYGNDEKNSNPGCFFPFDDYDTNKTSANNYAPKETRYNHHFGMTMSAQFSLPKDGMLGTNTPAVFNYSGDDDMWLYIDGVLVLDLGGIHGPQHGRINFATGQVTADGSADTTLSSIFADEGVKWENDKPHSLKMFYMERGGALSNLSMTITIPITRTVSVTKKVDGTTASDYLDQTFNYSAEIKPAGSNWQPYTGRVVIDGVTSNVGADGTFSLKPTQTAKLLDVKSTDHYRITETNVDGRAFDKVSISGNDSRSQTLNDGGSTDVSSDRNGLLAQNSLSNALTFTNHIREETKPLTVTKIWADNSNPNNKISSVKFQIIQTAHHADGTTTDTVWQDADGNSIFTAEASANWRRTFNNMLVRSGTTTYTYRVQEVDIPAGFTTSYTQPNKDAGSLSADITNKKRTQLTVKKVWKDTKGSTLSQTPSSVKVQLYKYQMPAKTATVSGQKVNVHFQTTYRGDAGGPGNNLETAATQNGDYTLDRKVTSGGGLTFTVHSFTDNFGVLSVEVNGQTLRPTATTTSSTNSYLPAGSSTWTPMVTAATYHLDNIKNDTTITVNMIGWMNYSGATSSVAATMDIRNLKTTEPSGGSTVVTEVPTPPKDMPADAVPVSGKTADLNATNNWQQTFGDLRVTEPKDGKLYYNFYYVKEVSEPSGYKVAYANDQANNTVTVTNTKVASLPKTGGTGIALYLGLGAALIAIAAILKKRTFNN
jgi:fibro-slime domain-containing protein/LPXTG-motif cell wall-anchored protein